MASIVHEKMKIESMKHMTKLKKLEKLPDPEYFFIPLSQHIGQVAKETVKKGDYVRQYEKIGEITGNISSNIHSPVSGSVEDIIENPLSNGVKVKTVKIKNDFEYNQMELEKIDISDICKLPKEKILEKIKAFLSSKVQQNLYKN